MTLHLIRHASAGARGVGAEDLVRPLDQRGFRQAESIAERLGAVDLEAVLSSPATRCIQTVEPLAKVLGLTVRVHEELAEGRRPEQTASLLRRLAAGGSTAALCTHGDIIPGVIGLLEHDGAIVSGNQCVKGSWWRLDVTNGHIVAATYVPPPT